MVNKRLIAILGLVGTMLLASTIVYGKSYEGMAVYRDGVIGSGNEALQWHAGIFTTRDMSSSNSPIVHISGPGETVSCVEYGEFVYGKGGEQYQNNFQGLYYSKDATSKQLRDIAKTAYELAGEDISYTFLDVLKPYSDCGKVIAPYEIRKIRCDGVVEYCYEWNGVEVSSFGSEWDISILKGCEAHNKKALRYGPKEQADNLTRYSRSVDN